MFFYVPFALFLVNVFAICSTQITTNQQIGSELFSIYNEENAPKCIKNILQEINSSCFGITPETVVSLAASIVFCENTSSVNCSDPSQRKGSTIFRCTLSNSEYHALSLGKFVYHVNMLCEYFAYRNISIIEKLMNTGLFNESKAIWLWVNSSPIGRGILSQFFYSKDLTPSFESNRLTAYVCYLCFSIVLKFQFCSIHFFTIGLFSFITESIITTILSFFDITKPHGCYLLALIIRYVWFIKLFWQYFKDNAKTFCSYFEEKKRNLRKK